ncbi:BTAD domain-containing putative transcriptional regulator [Nocardioides speluncae]|uniref:BTAD domain-containing putative transcriptional regulator n=1 Tax=Nocardioides speluncae TaxID=2670337 RepID=UPI000D68F647|nr:BTAD domain-containing putative transcriptional regulator [Nocardioides speluncae]
MPRGSARSNVVSEQWSHTRSVSAAVGQPPTPRRSSSHLLRPRLISALDGLRQVRLATVVAPAGAGKTTLFAQWARQAPVDVAWCRTSAGSGGHEIDSAEAMVRRLGDAVSGLAPQLSPARDLDTLVRELTEHDSPIVLVLDDAHRVVSPAAIRVLDQLLLRTPPHVHLLVGSRRPLGFNLARTELPSLVLPASALRFRSVETAALFRKVYDAPLAPDDVAALTRHTDGWAAALHLFHLSAPGSPVERHQAVRALSARVRYADDYLAREVLGVLTAAQVDFLRQTSVFEVLSARRCDRLLGGTDSQTHLLAIEQASALVCSADGGSSFQVHPVLRAHLATQLRNRLGDTEVEEAYRSAAAVLRGEPSPAEALRAYVAASDWLSVRDLLAADGPAVLADLRLDWVEGLPQPLIEDDPWVAHAVALRAFRNGELRKAQHAAELARRTAAASERTEVCALLAEQLEVVARTWADGDVLPSSAWGERLRAVVRDPAAAHDRSTAPPSPQQALVRAAGQLLAGNLVAARRTFASCADALHSDPGAQLTVGLLSTSLGALDPDAADDIADAADRLGFPWYARIAAAVADTLRYLTSPTPTLPLGEHLVDAENRGDAWACVVLLGFRGAASWVGGRPDPETFDELIRRLRVLDAPALEAWARAGLAVANAAAQLPDAARDAESAAGFARSAGVPGALAVAYGALSLCRTGPRATEAADLAAAEAEAAGLGCSPWNWVRTERPERPAGAVTVGDSDGPTLQVRCFGRFEIRVDGELPPLERVRPRAREVLRMLALAAGRPVHRELLIEALWPGLDPSAATHNLHVAVSSVRAVLEPGAPRGAARLLARDGDRYSLALGPGSTCDLQVFESSCLAAERARVAGDTGAAIRSLNVALEAYTGDVLPEDGPAEWVLAARERFRVRAAEAAALLAELHLVRDQAESAASAALRSIDIDPCRDGSWRLLVSAYDATGDLAAAERARRSYAEVLASLGVVANTASAVLPRPRRG